MSEFVRALYYIAFNEIGVREEAQNVGERIRTYQTATTLGPGAYSWCAAFVSWCLKKTLEEPAVLKELVAAKILPSIAGAEAWRCKSARAFDWEKWGETRKLTVIKNAIAPARRGDIVVYDFSHVGIIALDQLPGDTSITAIEGNTGIRGRVNDGVYARTRKVDSSIIASYIRILP